MTVHVNVTATTMNECDHHYCTGSVLYGHKNQIVVEKIGNDVPENVWHRGVLCCKCHNMMLVLKDKPFPHVRGKECNERWDDYHRRIDAYIREHGPLGG